MPTLLVCNTKRPTFVKVSVFGTNIPRLEEILQEPIWEFPKIRGIIFGVHKDYSTLGSILGYPYFGKLPYSPKNDDYRQDVEISSSMQDGVSESLVPFRKMKPNSVARPFSWRKNLTFLVLSREDGYIFCREYILLSREDGNIFCREYIRILFPYSLRRNSKNPAPPYYKPRAPY